MEKEKVTEELVRQNGNQAAAVMADYASQEGGGGSQGISVSEPVSAPVFREPTDEDLAKFSKGDGGAVVAVAEINGIVPLTIINAISPTDVAVMHLYGLGYMGMLPAAVQLKAMYRVSRPNTSNPSVTTVTYQISDDGSLLGEEGLS